MSTSFEHDDPLLKDVEGCAILGIAKPTWHKWVKNGLLPKPVKLGSMSRWPKSEIIAFRERAIAARSKAA